MNNILFRDITIQRYYRYQYLNLFLLCSSLIKRNEIEGIKDFVPSEYQNWIKKEHLDRNYWQNVSMYIGDNFSDDILSKVYSLIKMPMPKCSFEDKNGLGLNRFYSYEQLDKWPKEKLIELVLNQNRIIDGLQNEIDSFVFGREHYSDSLSDVQSESTQVSTDNPSINLFVRDRSGKKVEPNQSNIDLREDDYIRDEDKGNGEDASIDSTMFRHTMIDFLRVIYTLWKLGYFVEFNPEVMGKKDFNLQKKAKLKDVIEAFGNAINMPDLFKAYDNQFAKSFSENENKLRVIRDEDILRIFDRMRNAMVEEIKNRKEKRERKNQ